MRFTLINPPSLYLENDAAYPPTGLLYLAAVLLKSGHMPVIEDMATYRDWQDRSRNISSDIVGITCVTPNMNVVRKITSLIKPDIPIILGGPHPSFMPQGVLSEMRCDAVVVGEAELIIKELVEDYAHRKLKKIYRGTLVQLKDIPKPARQLIDLKKYYPGKRKAAVIYTSRGCPFACVFCSKLTCNTYRVFPVKRVLQEIEEIIDMGMDYVVFGDDNAGISKGRLENLLLNLAPYRKKIKFRLNADAKNISDKKILSLAAQNGCDEISFGVESGSAKILKLMGKICSVEDNARAIKSSKSFGIKTKAYFVVNFPGETEKTIDQTLRFAQKTRPDKWLLSSFAPLPGSFIWSHPEKYGITYMSDNWEDYYLAGKTHRLRPCFETESLSFARQAAFRNRLYEGLCGILGPS